MVRGQADLCLRPGVASYRSCMGTSLPPSKLCFALMQHGGFFPKQTRVISSNRSVRPASRQALEQQITEKQQTQRSPKLTERCPPQPRKGSRLCALLQAHSGAPWQPQILTGLRRETSAAGHMALCRRPPPGPCCPQSQGSQTTRAKEHEKTGAMVILSPDLGRSITCAVSSSLETSQAKESQGCG